MSLKKYNEIKYSSKIQSRRGGRKEHSNCERKTDRRTVDQEGATPSEQSVVLTCSCPAYFLVHSLALSRNSCLLYLYSDD